MFGSGWSYDIKAYAMDPLMSPANQIMEHSQKVNLQLFLPFILIGLNMIIQNSYGRHHCH